MHACTSRWNFRSAVTAFSLSLSHSPCFLASATSISYYFVCFFFVGYLDVVAFSFIKIETMHTENKFTNGGSEQERSVCIGARWSICVQKWSGTMCKLLWLHKYFIFSVFLNICCVGRKLKSVERVLVFVCDARFCWGGEKKCLEIQKLQCKIKKTRRCHHFACLFYNNITTWPSYAVYLATRTQINTYKPNRIKKHTFHRRNSIVCKHIYNRIIQQQTVSRT